MYTDTAAIRSMFGALAERYDLFNRLVSLGMDRSWRRETVHDIQPGMRVLDVGTGTGDLAFEALRRLNGQGEVVGLDFSAPMLRLAREKGRRLGLGGKIRWVELPAWEIPFEDEPYDIVISGFVLRNLLKDIDRVLDGIFHALRPGGLIRFLDITEPDHAVMRWINQAYFRTIVRGWGKLCFGDSHPVDYLEDSIASFPRVIEFQSKLASHGFRNLGLKRFLGGTITLYEGVKY